MYIERRIMKKRVLVLVSIMLVVVMVLAACGAASGPSDTAKKFMDSIKSGDINAMADCFEPKVAAVFKATMDMMGDEAIDLGQIMGESGVDTSSISYSVTNEKIDGDTATVTVEMKATVNGEEQTNSTDLPLAKVDGKWYISQDFGI